MANLVVWSELHENRWPTPTTRQALAQARTISNALGATVHALVATACQDAESLDALAREFGAAGADRVMVWPTSRPLALPLYNTHGPLLETVAKRLRPRLFIFPLGAAAVQLAPPFAARVSAEFFPHAEAVVVAAALAEGRAGSLRLRRVHASWQKLDELDVMEADRMVVCVFAAPLTEGVRGEGTAELEVLAMATPAAPEVLSIRSTGNSACDAHTVFVCEANLDVTGIDGTSCVRPAGLSPLFGMLCPTHAVMVTNSLTVWPPLLAVGASHGIGWVGNGTLPRGTKGLTARWRVHCREAAAITAHLRGLTKDGS